MNTTRRPSRRHALAGIAAASVAPFAGNATPSTDPIFAAIADYKAAVAERCRTFGLTWNGGNPALAHLGEHHPDCVPADEIHEVAADREFERLDNLFKTMPTSIAGFAALFEFIATDPYEPFDGKCSFAENVFDTAFADEDERFELMAAYFGDLAAALRDIQQRGQPS